MKKIFLKPTKEKSILRKHPWIFSGAIKKIEDGICDGEIIEVYSNKGRYLATGHYTNGTISVRIFEFEQQPIDKSYWKNKFSVALKLRTDTISINKTNNVFRLIHA